MSKIFNYTNDLGYRKQIHVAEEPNAEGEYPCSIWCNGDMCSAGTMTATDLNEFLGHYHIDYRVEVSA